MTRMTGPDCAVMRNLINMHTYMYTYIHIVHKYTYNPTPTSSTIVVEFCFPHAHTLFFLSLLQRDIVVLL